MIDITRLNELHSAANGERWNDTDQWRDAISTAWPAVSERLALLEEFSRRIDKAARMFNSVSTADEVVDACEWLDEETKKASEA